MDKILRKMREIKPVVHCIGNDISTRDSANLLLAAGRRPVMTFAPQEAEEISAHSRATVLNCGTPTEEKFAGLTAAAKGRQNHPLVIDPVGVGASRWRKEKIKTLLLQAVSPRLIIHCNYSEALALAEDRLEFTGVDSVAGSLTSKEKTAVAVAQKYNATVIITGRQDVISDGKRLAVVYGGSRKTALVSGSGCMLGALLGAFSVAADSFSATVTASAFWKKRAQLADTGVTAPGSFRTALIDSAYIITDMEDIQIEYK